MFSDCELSKVLLFIILALVLLKMMGSVERMLPICLLSSMICKLQKSLEFDFLPTQATCFVSL